MTSIRIVLAEDHALVREGTRRILEQDRELSVVGEAGDGQRALELIERLTPDVAIIDIHLPRLNGIEVVRGTDRVSPSTRALVLTAFDDDDYILALMEVGASGYLMKTARASELVEAVRLVHQGEVVLHPAVAARLGRLWGRHQASARDPAAVELSRREREVLDLAAHGFRNRAIAERLCISVRTVEGHFSSILDKLGVSSRTEAVLAAVSRHWVSLEGDLGRGHNQ